MAESANSEILIIKVPKPFKAKIREKARDGGYGTIANYIRSILREQMDPSEPNKRDGSLLNNNEVKAFLAREHENGGGMVVMDKDTYKIMLADDSYAKMLGYSVHEIIGKYVPDLYPQSAHKSIERHYKIIERNKQHAFVAPHIGKNGKVFNVLVDVRSILDEDGKIRFVMANVRPIGIS
jgi:PAS domain S-box-containing protein